MIIDDPIHDPIYAFKMYKPKEMVVSPDTPKSKLKTWDEFKKIYGKQGFENTVKIGKMYAQYLETETQLGNSPQEQKGNNPMCYANKCATNSSASLAGITVQTSSNVSDIQIQREYLLNRLSQANYAKQTELQTLYNLYVGDGRPKTSKDLIDMITTGKFTLDEKKVAKQDKKLGYHYDEDEDCYYQSEDAFFAIIWNGPKPDKDGYTAALKLRDAEFNKSKDQIMISNPEKGLAAIQSFEAWLPSVTVH